jgi:predicted metal-dependent phosphoesterase TrpH
MDPVDIVRRCKKIGYDTISITDHNTIKGSLKAKEFARDYDLNIIVGAEYSTNAGDIIGLNLSENITCTDYLEVIEQIHKQGGICVLPHPFRGHKEVSSIVKLVEMVEIWNARSTTEQNRRAEELSKEHSKAVIAGSDAHVFTELGHVKNYINDPFDANKSYHLQYSSHREKNFSYLIRDIKLRKYFSFPYHMVRLLF